MEAKKLRVQAPIYGGLAFVVLIALCVTRHAVGIPAELEARAIPLLAELSIPAEVLTFQGRTAVLDGFVQTDRQIEQAEAAIQELEGIRRVQNRLRLEPRPSSEMRVIETVGGLRLEGRVPDRQSRDRLVAAAREIPAVEDVVERLEIAGRPADPEKIEILVRTLPLLEEFVEQASVEMGLDGMTVTGRVRGEQRLQSFEGKLLDIVGEVPLETRLKLEPKLDREGLQTLLDAILAQEPIEFAPGSTRLGETATLVILRLARILRRAPECPVQIVAFTDGPESGPELSEERALAVLRGLVDLGQPEDRFRPVGSGVARPTADRHLGSVALLVFEEGG